MQTEASNWYKKITAYPRCASNGKDRATIIEAPSTIPGAGTGVFAARDIAKDEYIVEYIGYFQTSADMTPAESTYAMGVGNGVSIIGDNIAAKINDTCLFERIDDTTPEGLEKVQQMFSNRVIPRHATLDHNAKYVIIGMGELARCFVAAARDIKKGEELFADYGPSYWMSRFVTAKLVNAELAKDLNSRRIQREFAEKREAIEKLTKTGPADKKEGGVKEGKQEE